MQVDQQHPDVIWFRHQRSDDDDDDGRQTNGQHSWLLQSLLTTGSEGKKIAV